MPKTKFHDQTTIPDLAIEEKVSSAIPDYIGPYKIESLLNKGGMSLLYLAVDPKTQKAIVIKVLSPKYLGNKEVVARFLKEAKIIGMTDHPNIIKFFDQGRWEKGLYIAMEFIQGISLKQFILQKSLSPKKSVQIILQVAYALCHLHTHGVIHRDLKPENILICESGAIKVIDFGIAQLDQDLHLESPTLKKRIMGTPIYMSPEQKEDPENVSYVSDIYSLGIITYELFLGRLSHGVIHLSLLPRNLRSIIEKALKINPEERFQDIVDFISEISSYLKQSDEKDKFDVSQPEEIVESVFNALKVCQPTLPISPQLEIGQKCQEGLFFSGLYYDFFRIDQKMIICLAEPKNSGIESMVYTGMFRGMLRSLMENKKGQKTSLPELSSFLNEMLFSDRVNEVFSFSFALLDPERDLLSLLLCKSHSVYHLTPRKKEAAVYSSTNLFLGQEQNTSFFETTDNWTSEDILLFRSKAFPEKNLSSLLFENRRNSAEAICKEVFLTGTKQSNSPLFSLCIKRIF